MRATRAQSHEQQCGMPGGAERGVQGLTNLHLEVVEGVLIDVLHLLHEVHGVVGQRRDVAPALAVVGGRVEPRCRHVGAANGLDLLQLPVFLLADDLRRQNGSPPQHADRAVGTPNPAPRPVAP